MLLYIIAFLLVVGALGCGFGDDRSTEGADARAPVVAPSAEGSRITVANLLAVDPVGLAPTPAAPWLIYEPELPDSLDPITATEGVQRRLTGLVFDRIAYQRPADGTWHSRVLREWIPQEQGLLLTVRPDVAWQDREPLVPADVCRSIALQWKPPPPPESADPDPDLAGAEPPPPPSPPVCEVRSVSKVFVGAGLEELDIFLLPAHLLDAQGTPRTGDWAQAPVGSGPMQGAVGKTGVFFEMRETAHHVRVVEGLRFMQMPSEVDQGAALRSGEVHLIMGATRAPPGFNTVRNLDDEVVAVGIKSAPHRVDDAFWSDFDRWEWHGE